MDKNITNEKINAISPIIDKIKKYLRAGFYFAHNFELTLNAQKRARLDELANEGQAKRIRIGDTKSMDIRYMWNSNLCKDFKAQKISSFWFIKLI